jgi:hypothetical protein
MATAAGTTAARLQRRPLASTDRLTGSACRGIGPVGNGVVRSFFSMLPSMFGSRSPAP